MTIYRPGAYVYYPGSPGVRVVQPGGEAAEPLIYDTFTDADDTLLEAHAPDINIPGNPWVSGNKWKIVGNTGRLVDNTFYSTELLINTGRTGYRVTAKIVLASAPSANIRGIVVRNDGANNGVPNASQFKAGLLYNANRFEIQEGSSTVRATAAFVVTPGVAYTIVVECVGSTISATVNGGVPISYALATEVGRSYIGTTFRYALDYIDDLLVVAL